MYERTYDIIDWKSCASGSVDDSSAPHHVNKNDIPAVSSDQGLAQKASGGSNSEIIVFPTLFYEDNESETSIVTLPSFESDCWRSHEETHEGVPDDIEQLSVYQKVANWVFTQKVFFRKEEEHVIEDDDLEVIDPVDLFHESILDDYLLVTEDDIERRSILRDLNDNRYDIVSVQELMQTHEYKFIREPKGDVELELEQIVEYSEPKTEEKSKKGKTRKKSRKRRVSACGSLDAEGLEENILFLGVPRLLENYVILNREGYKVNLDDIPDLWLSPFEENLNENNGADEDNHSELEFLSSWFSDVYQTDIITTDRRPTLMTDMFEKLTVITVGSDDDEVWLDAPEIPHWLDEEPEELELFNQPSRPLYYYRDRIKGCYRIIGVEDEQVVLFSGNDDDTIFYADENSFNPTTGPMNTINELDTPPKDDRMTGHIRPPIPHDPGPGIVSKYRRIYNRLRYGKVDKDDTNDTKHDSGIDEDIDENACEDMALSPFSLSTSERASFCDVVSSVKRPSFSINPKKESFVEILFVVMGAVIVLITLVLYDGNSPLFQMYRSRITEEACDDIFMLVKSVFR